MKGKTNFSRLLKQFDGLTWLTLTPIFFRQSISVCNAYKMLICLRQLDWRNRLYYLNIYFNRLTSICVFV